MSSYEYDEACIQAFLEQQLKLFPEEVAETPEELSLIHISEPTRP